MASKILTKHKQNIDTFELEPSGGGCFELTIDGKLVYSKLATGQFPDEDEILNQIDQRL